MKFNQKMKINSCDKKHKNHFYPYLATLKRRAQALAMKSTVLHPTDTLVAGNDGILTYRQKAAENFAVRILNIQCFQCKLRKTIANFFHHVKIPIETFPTIYLCSSSSVR